MVSRGHPWWLYRLMRKLLLLRHAQAENTRPGSRDRDRRLTVDGERQAIAVGGHLRAGETEVDLVIASSAARTLQTAELLGLTAPIEEADDLYDAGGETILALINELPDDAKGVLLVGHAPGLPWVAGQLADPGTSDPEALAAIERRFPPATLAILESTGAWAGLQRASLVAVHLTG
jgi:phosphohistidine phosphatase